MLQHLKKLKPNRFFKNGLYTDAFGTFLEK